MQSSKGILSGVFKDGIIFRAKGRKRRNEFTSSFVAVASTSCAFKIACRDISTSYPSKLHAITGILDSTTMLPMLITSPYTGSSRSMFTAAQFPYFIFFFFLFLFTFLLRTLIRDRNERNTKDDLEGCVQFSLRLIFLRLLLIHLPSTTIKGSRVTWRDNNDSTSSSVIAGFLATPRHAIRFFLFLYLPLFISAHT